MPFTATCACGASYSLKDEFAGRHMRCPACKASFHAEPPPLIGTLAQADPVFDRDKFLLRQKVMSINQKYFVSNELNQPIVYVERPTHFLRSLLAALGGIATFAAVAALIIAPSAMLLGDHPALVFLIPFGILCGVAGALVVGILLSLKRHVGFYRDETKADKLLEILQDKKFQPINATYTVLDASGQVIARFRKNILYNMIRKRWYCYGPDGAMVCVAMEDSAILALLRRFLGHLYGLLRTNYILLPDTTSEVELGEFNRKFTLFDRYVLDLTPDTGRTLDRRIALALGVMLDTGERR